MGIGIGINIGVGMSVAADTLLSLDFVNDVYVNAIMNYANNLSSDDRVYRQGSGFTAVLLENADGSLVSRAGSILHRTNLGLWVEPTATNVALWSRDLTNAAWTKTNCTVAKDQTGRDGAANSASRVTVTTGGATISQAIIDASKLRLGAVDVKQLVGTGTIEMSMDNGTTYTTLNLNAPRFNGIGRYLIPTQTLANPTVKFRFGTSGDQFLIDHVQIDDQPYETSPIVTTTASVQRFNDRAFCEKDKNGGLNHGGLCHQIMDAGSWWRYIEFYQRRAAGNIMNSDTSVQVGSNSTAFTTSNTGQPGGRSGTITASNPLIVATDARFNTPAQLNKILWTRASDGSGMISLNGSTPVVGGPNTLGMTNPLGTHFDLGMNGSVSARIDGLVRKEEWGNNPSIWTSGLMIAKTT